MSTFRTEIKFEEFNLKANHETRFLFFGSCFADNIRRAFERHYFKCLPLTHGIVYHPLPIAQALLEIANKTHYSSSDLFLHEGRYKSWMHHGSFNGADESAVLDGINKRFDEAGKAMDFDPIIIVTFGTAMGYKLKETGRIVANCHRMPQQLFDRDFSKLSSLIDSWKQVIKLYHDKFPNIRWVFTVSPVRHLKEGFIENQRSKARLLLLCEEISRENGCYYFPSYEILMDDLRDYRFYNEDGIHPSSLAVGYIKEIFYRNIFSSSTLEKLNKIEPLVRKWEHRSIHETTEEMEKRKAESLKEIRLILNAI